VLLRLFPGAGDDDVQDGVVVAHNPCLSGGSLEIFLDPHLAAPRVLIVGDTPIARALETVAAAAGYSVSRGGEIDPQRADAALVVASHGDEEERALVQALEVGVGYVALVASPRRGAAVLQALDVDEALRSLVHTPAGLDLGARAPADIAISILAQLIALRTTHAPEASAPEPVRTAVDPVCGMNVMVSDSTPHLEVGGEDFYFCCEGCRSTYAAQHTHAG
jgi:xanthine dehydrogenase accessory factor